MVLVGGSWRPIGAPQGTEGGSWSHRGGLWSVLTVASGLDPGTPTPPDSFTRSGEWPE